MINLLIEKYIGRAPKGMSDIGGEVFVNPSSSELNSAGGKEKKIRFIANSITEKLYVWNYKSGYHEDVWHEYIKGNTDKSLNNFNSIWGIAKRLKGEWVFYRSDSQSTVLDSVPKELIKMITDQYKWVQSNFNVTKWFTDEEFRIKSRSGRE